MLRFRRGYGTSQINGRDNEKYFFTCARMIVFWLECASKLQALSNKRLDQLKEKVGIAALCRPSLI
jgi:hypothetical protein